MRISSRSIAATALLFALSACGARNGGGLIPSSGPAGAGRHRVSDVIRPVDMGRIAQRRRVSAVVVLRYNHQRELDAFVNRLARESHPHYLSPKEFRARFAATPQQHQRVIEELRAAGFTIDRTYDNRTTIDVSAPARNVERLFSTELHQFRQGRHGIRFANVKPIRIPNRLQALVAAVDVNDLVLLHSQLEVADADAAELPDLLLSNKTQATGTLTPSSANVVRNPGFEKGKLSPWAACGSTKNAPAGITKDHPHSGKYDGYAGTFQNRSEPDGIAAVCQAVTIPRGATLTFYSYGILKDHSKKVFQFAALYSSGGKLVKLLHHSRRNDRNWVKQSYDLSAYGGQKDLLVLGVVGVSKHTNKIVGQFVDDVSIAGGSGPTPTPVPTMPPCKPSSVPSSTPTPNVGPDNGWGPAAVAAGFDLPSGYGYAGACETAAIVIDATVNPSDLSTYLTHFGIRRTGTVTNVAIDGGAGQDTEGEATLDLETIAGLAPNANVIMYVVPSLAFTAIDDAYSKALSDANAKVINSSFGGCESGDPSFDTASNALAEQGAATGVTFSASSGDQGADCFVSSGNYALGAGAPASDPYFVGVGGSQSTSPAGPSTCYDSATSIASPAVWSDCVGAGGGGLSATWTPPPYQSGLGSSSHRNVPDIAMPAAYDDFYFTGGSSSSGWGLIWGTSWASPIYVAMQTEINEACGASWGINTMYGTFGASHYADFIDVTSGTNTWANPYYSTYDGYPAATGFDNVSGIGMPLGMAIAVDDCSVPAMRQRR